MDNNSDRNDSRWVEDCLAALRTDGDWQPDAARGLARFREQRLEKRSRVRRRSWLAAGVLAAALPLMAFSSTREFAQRCVSACVSQSSWALDFFRGESRSAASTTFVKAADRKMASDFVLADASGKPVKLSDFRGKDNVVLAFYVFAFTGG